ncbi:dihydrofolate reductase [uncultured Nocardioides sp.]|uniref:dihydrofolate reductase n=1 Tax=uncultured Nocardioides sp. TaxID=198441 RepID=UPI00260EF904|nr:dihydrofolate reductase [uncultured Nocardioides sp.]
MASEHGTRVVLIAAVARNGVIGADGDIPWRVPADFAHFKATTTGHTLLMGRATYDSIGRPLPGRTTIVLTRDAGWRADGVLVAHTLDEALAQVPSGTDLYVAGGAAVYAAVLGRDGLTDEQLISEIDLEPDGDVRFPAYDAAAWVEVSREAREGFTLVRRRAAGPRPDGGRRA